MPPVNSLRPLAKNRLFASLLSLALSLSLTATVLAAPPVSGDLIINEYSSDNDASGADYVELLVLTDNLDLRGLRISDNELVGGVLNNNESVLVFGQDAYLNNVPKGTTIAVYTITAGVTTDTITDPSANDWKLVLAPGTGFTTGVDGLGGSINNGLSTGGEALYVYLPGADGTSAGTDNVYLDFVSFESDGGEPPAGFTDINLPSVSDNGYYTGNTASGNDTAANWVVYDGPPPNVNATPGEPNPGQDLSGLRGTITAALTLTITPASFSEVAGVQAATGTVTRSGPNGLNLTVTLTSSNTSAATIPATVLILANSNTATFGVDAVDDLVVDGPQPVVVTASATGFTSVTSNVTVTDNEGTVGTLRIHDLQGISHRSPSNGSTVTNIPGIVTAVRNNGFFFQEPDATVDADLRTSEGMFVFTSSAPSVTVGDAVLVSGTLTEFVPGGATSGNLSTTEITGPMLTITSIGNTLPSPTVIGVGGRVPPSQVIDNDATGSVDTSGVFEPATDGIDFYESLEGMRVQVNGAVAVAPTNSFGEIIVLGDNGINATGRTARGGIHVQAGDFNPERIFIDDAIISGPPQVNTGDQFTAPIVGVLDYNFGNFKLLNTSALPAVNPINQPREVTSLVASPNQLTIAAYNVENLDPGDGTRFAALAQLMVNNMGSPDIFSLEEVQDNSGASNNGVLDADQSLNTLISAIQAAGGPTYSFRQINPAPGNLDGGEPGGNIRVAFLYNPSRVQFVDRPGGDATTATTVVSGANGPQLTFSPGRVDPNNSAFNSSRKPLAGEFVFNGRTFFVVANHFNSKGGDQPLFGVSQPPVLSSEVQRNQQATVVNAFVDSILSLSPQANVVVLGDLNDFEFSTPLAILKGNDLINLVERVPAADRYSFIFDGNSQVLDHILVSSSLEGIAEQDFVHIDPEYLDAPSDHDAMVVRFTFAAPVITGFSPLSGTPGTVVTITGTELTGTTAVTVNGVAASFTVNSATQITATVPVGATTGPVAITTPGGTVTSTTNFIVVPVPTLTSFTPTTGTVGTAVVLTGTEFTGTTAVSFNGTAASFTVNSATQITATVPTGATTGTIAITTPNGVVTSTASFTVIPAPSITTVTPTQGPSGTRVTITGTGFTGTTAVTFNGVTVPFTLNSATQITATVSVGVTTGTVVVTTPGGTATGGTFTVLPSPNLVNTLTISGDSTDLNPGTGANANRLGGFFSDLFYDRFNNVYYGLVDRGPGGGTISYDTRVQKFTLDVDPATGTISNLALLDTILFTDGTTAFNGLNPGLLNGNKSVLGLSLDPEGLVVTPNGNFFVADEYGPSVYEFGADGVLIRAFTTPANFVPKESSGTLNYVDGRPTITSGRQDNRGYEGLTLSPDGTKLYGLLQDPLVNEGTSGSSNDGRYSRNLRMVRFDVATGVSDAQYIYVLDDILSINNSLPAGSSPFGSSNQGRSIGISSLTALSATEFLVIERDNRGLGVDAPTYPNTTNLVGQKRVFRVDLTGATDVSTVSLAGTNTLPGGVIPVTKTLFLDLKAAISAVGQLPAEKLEGLAVGPRLTDGSYALIIGSDNDFSVTQNGSNQQFDVCTDGTTSTQVPLDTSCPVGQSLIPTVVYSFTTDQVTPAATLNSFSPATGVVGTTIVIQGTSLSGTTAVSFNGVAASFTVNSDSQLTATVPVGATTGLISITTPAGTTSSTTSFTVIPTPAITSFTPGSGIVGTLVTINGSNFTGTTAVTFNGVAAGFVVNTPNQITTSVPVTATSGPLAVTTANGTTTSSTNFTVLPFIQRFNPIRGRVGTQVLITGTGFSNVTAVTFNGTPATFQVLTVNKIGVKVPVGATTGPITVFTTAGSYQKGTFTVTP